MEKWILLFSISICLSLQSFGQSLSRTVVSAAGATTSNGQYSISWTVGEVFGSDVLGGHHLTAGFQQGGLETETSTDSVTVRGMEETTDQQEVEIPLIQAQVYPNPTTDYLYIKLEEAIEGSARLLIFNDQGQQVLTAQHLATGQKSLLVDQVQQLAAGVYFAQLHHQGQAIYVAPFVKK